MPIEAPFLHLRGDEEDTSRRGSHRCDNEEVDEDMPVYGDGLFPSATDTQRRKETKKKKQVGTLVSYMPPRYSQTKKE